MCSGNIGWARPSSPMCRARCTGNVERGGSETEVHGAVIERLQAPGQIVARHEGRGRVQTAHRLDPVVEVPELGHRVGDHGVGRGVIVGECR